MAGGGFDWTEFLALAGQLAQKNLNVSSREAALRTAISRAYYAAFCLARNHLLARGELVVQPTSEAHRDVAQYYQVSHDKTRREIGVNLARLRLDRNKADYDDIVPGLDTMCQVDLSLAGRILSTLQRPPSS